MHNHPSITLIHTLTMPSLCSLAPEGGNILYVWIPCVRAPCCMRAFVICIVSSHIRNMEVCTLGSRDFNKKNAVHMGLMYVKNFKKDTWNKILFFCAFYQILVSKKTRHHKKHQKEKAKKSFNGENKCSPQKFSTFTENWTIFINTNCRICAKIEKKGIFL